MVMQIKLVVVVVVFVVIVVVVVNVDVVAVDYADCSMIFSLVLFLIAEVNSAQY